MMNHFNTTGMGIPADGQDATPGPGVEEPLWSTLLLSPASYWCVPCNSIRRMAVTHSICCTLILLILMTTMTSVTPLGFVMVSIMLPHMRAAHACHALGRHSRMSDCAPRSTEVERVDMVRIRTCWRPALKVPPSQHNSATRLASMQYSHMRVAAYCMLLACAQLLVSTSNGSSHITALKVQHHLTCRVVLIWAGSLKTVGLSCNCASLRASWSGGQAWIYLQLRLGMLRRRDAACYPQL